MQGGGTRHRPPQDLLAQQWPITHPVTNRAAACTRMHPAVLAHRSAQAEGQPEMTMPHGDGSVGELAWSPVVSPNPFACVGSRPPGWLTLV
jgi:hypothetical protein